MKNHDFRPMSRFVLEMIQDRAIVTTERSYVIYRMVPFPMILSDLAKYSTTSRGLFATAELLLV